MSLWHHNRALRRPGRRPGRSRVLRGVLVLAVAMLSLPVMSGVASAAANLTVTPITWNVVGLDSNKPTEQGPDMFASGARVCNTGDAVAMNVVSTYLWDTANVYINSSGLTTLTLPSLPVGACSDFYYNIAITRDVAAYDTTRRFHITATADGLAVASSPVPREIYVEHLVSQNRNSIYAITGPATVYVGNTYTYVLDSSTAPGGYEQLSSFLNFPNAIFQIVSVNSTYTTPAGGTNSTIYGDGCGWDPVPTSATYRSCIGPPNYVGGKVGDTVTTTYVVKIVAGGTSTVSGLVYDFSGSSYHYNSDFGVGINSLTITALNQADVSVSIADAPDPVTAGTDLTYTLTVSNAGPSPATGVQVTDPIPAGTSFVSASNGGTLSSGTVTWNVGTIAPGASVTRTLVVHVNANQTSALTDTAAVTTTATDTNAANDSASQGTAVVASADLSIVKSDSPDPVSVDENLTYTLNVANAGPSDATAVVVSDALPAGAAYVFSSASQGSCSQSAGTVTCALGGLAATGTASVTIVVAPGVAGVLSNTASVSSSTSDPSGGNNSSTQGTTVQPRADLSITKSSSPDPVDAGDDLTYTIVVSNAGPSSANTVSVDDPLPTGTDFVSADNGGTLSSGTVTWNLGTIASGASVTLTLVVHVHPSRTNDLSNTATVSTATVDPNAANDSVTAPTTLSTSADLAVTGSDAPDPLGVGDDLTYTLNVTNGGPSDAVGVSLVDTLPPGVTFVSAVPTAGSCLESGGVVTCSLGDVTSGGSETVTIVVRPTVPGTITNQAAVSSSTPDASSGNDSTSMDTDVQPRADVSISIADAPDPVTAGTDLTYTVTVANGGPSSAAGVSVSVPLPAGTSFVSADNGGTLASGTVTWNLGALGSGSSTMLTLVVHVDPDRTADVASSAAVATSTFDTDATNDADSATTAVSPSADLSVSIVDAPDPVVVGGIVTYTVSVANAGPSDAAGVTLVDTIPGGTVFVSATPTQGSCLQNLGVVTCTLGAIAAGAGADVDVVVSVGGIGSVTDQASVSASTPDPDASNDDATEDTSVTPVVDLAVALDDGALTVVAGASTTYDLSATNNGPVALPAGAVITASIPAGTSASESEADCDIVGSTLTCTTSTVLAVGNSVTWQVTLEVDPDYALGTVDLVASIASSPYVDMDPSNDGAIDSDAVTTSADLSVGVDDGVGLVTAGDLTTYSITLMNGGPSTVPAGATVAALAPPGTTPSESEADCQIVLGMLGCTSAVALAPGDSVTWQLTLTLDPDYAAATVDLTAAVGVSPIADPDASNDSDTDADAVTSSADLAVSLDDGAAVITPGTSSTYTLTLSNNAPSTEPAGATVTVPVPAGTTPSESEADCQISGALLTCSTPASLAPGGSIAWQFTLAIDPGFVAATLDVTAGIVSTPVPDPDGSNDSATDTDAVGASADVAVSIADFPDPVDQGQPLTYTLGISNAGPSGATAVTVVDTLPPSVAFVSATPSQGTCSQAAGVVTCDLGILSSGATASIVIIVTPGSVGSITDQASVSATESDPDLANNTDSEDSLVDDPTDLSVQIADAPDPVVAGQNVTYTLAVANAGPSDATGVVVTDTLPAGVVFVSATPTQGSCSPLLGIVTCPLGGVVSGASATVTIVVTTSGAGVLTDQASVSGNEPDPQPANNSDSEATSVNAIGAPSTDLSISIADAPDPASVGQDVTYTATVSNAGPAGATGVTVTDTLPAGATFVSATPSQGTCSQLAGTVTCPLGAVASGGSATVAIVVRPTLAGTMTDSATVQGAEIDPTPADATDSENTLVNASANLSVTKVATPNPVALGQNLTYTMVVSNAGPSNATGVTLTDPLPAGVTFVSATSTVGTCVLATGTVTCTIGNLAASASATVTLVVTPTVAGPISNTATVDGNEPDPAAANDAATAAATVTASADLSLTKTASPDPVIVGEDLTYTLVVTNAGPVDAAGVTVTDPLPTGMTFVSADAGGTETSGTVTWVVGAVPSGGSVTLTLVVRPDASTTGSVTNTATVSATTADPDATDNVASAAVTVDAPRAVTADLSVTKTVDDDAATAGDLVTYTITVTDDGPADATGVVVKDDLPHGLTFISATASKGTYDAHSGMWDVGDLALGDVERLEIRARVTSGETIDNVATVAAVDQSDPVEGNDAAVQGLTVVNASDPTDPTDPAVLAFTGSRVGQLTALALGLLLAGLALIVLGRRRDDEQEEPAPTTR